MLFLFLFSLAAKDSISQTSFSGSRILKVIYSSFFSLVLRSISPLLAENNKKSTGNNFSCYHLTNNILCYIMLLYVIEKAV